MLDYLMENPMYAVVAVALVLVVIYLVYMYVYASDEETEEGAGETAESLISGRPMLRADLPSDVLDQYR